MPLRPPAGFIRPGYDPLKVPNAPTGVSASGGDQSASVSFTAPSNTGGSAISGYGARAVNASTGESTSATGTSSPITVTGLTNGVTYNMAVWALNSYGPGPYGLGGSVEPVAPIGLFGGVSGNTINRITFNTTGNATDFGDLLGSGSVNATAASSTRGVFIGDTGSSAISYVTIATNGNAQSFGSISTTFTNSCRGCSSSTRGVFGGGNISGNVTTALQYITIATLGNSTSFGNLTVARNDHCANIMSPTRGIFAGGMGKDGSPVYNVIDYITIGSTGNATDFGDLAVTTRALAGASSSTRGLFAGGTSSDASTRFNTISYITLASTGNAIDFGDLTSVSSQTGGGAGGARAVFIIGNIDSSGYPTNRLDYVTIASTGNAIDFGDMLAGGAGVSILSNAHGGLQ